MAGGPSSTACRPVIEPHCRQRPPALGPGADAAHLLRAALFNLADAACEDAVLDSAAPRRFVGIVALDDINRGLDRLATGVAMRDLVLL